MNCARFLVAERDAPDATFLVEGQTRFSYGDLARDVRHVARWLRDARLAQGDFCFLVSENAYRWAVFYLAVLSAGGVVVPLPPSSSARDVERIAKRLRPRFVFHRDRLAPLFATDAFAGSTVAAIDAIELDGSSATGGSFDALEWAGGGDDLAAIMFTSGSTSEPKGVMVSHRNIVANTQSIVAYLGLTGADRVLQVLPLHYCFGTSLLHTHLRVGGSIVLHQDQRSPNRILDRLNEHACTGFAGVPTTFQLLLTRSDIRTRSLPTVRYVQQAGGRLAPHLVLELQAAVPHAKVFIGYGQTEATARVTYLPPERVRERPGSVGVAVPGVDVRIRRPDGEEAAPEEIGELVVRGPSVTLGYFGETPGSDSPFRDGALHTGDLARRSEDGFITIAGRTSDFLKVAGQRVSAAAIEDAMARFPGVVEVAVVPAEDPLLGEAVSAFVVHGEGERTREAFVRFCERELPVSQWPKRVTFVASLPRNASNKVDKGRLREAR